MGRWTVLGREMLAVWDDSGLLSDAAAAQGGKRQPSLCSTPPPPDHVAITIASSVQGLQNNHRAHLPVAKNSFVGGLKAQKRRRLGDCCSLPVFEQNGINTLHEPKQNQQHVARPRACGRLLPLPLQDISNHLN